MRRRIQQVEEQGGVALQVASPARTWLQPSRGTAFSGRWVVAATQVVFTTAYGDVRWGCTGREAAAAWRAGRRPFPRRPGGQAASASCARRRHRDARRRRSLLVAAAGASAFSAHGSVEQLYVTGLAPNAQMSLLRSNGETVSTHFADSAGGFSPDRHARSGLPGPAHIQRQRIGPDHRLHAGRRNPGIPASSTRGSPTAATRT